MFGEFGRGPKCKELWAREINTCLHIPAVAGTVTLKTQSSQQLREEMLSCPFYRLDKCGAQVNGLEREIRKKTPDIVANRISVNNI